jgi:hypothetical protein
MASGDTLLIMTAEHANPPNATTAAQLTVMGGASTPAESIPVVAFDDTTEEFMDYRGVMPQFFSGGGTTVIIGYSAAEAAPDVVAWGAAFRRIADDAEDLDTTSHSYDFNVVVDTAPSAVGEVAYASITFTAGADMDGVVAGDYFDLRIFRDTTPSSGTDVTGDASIHFIEIRET